MSKIFDLIREGSADEIAAAINQNPTVLAERTGEGYPVAVMMVLSDRPDRMSILRSVTEFIHDLHGIDRVCVFLIQRIENLGPGAEDHEQNILHIAAKTDDLELLHFCRYWELRMRKTMGDSILSAAASGQNFPLHLAVMNNHPEMVEALVVKYPQTLNSANGDGQTPLHLAFHSGNYRITRFLIQMGIETINQRDFHGGYPLHAAATSNSLEQVQLALAVGSIHPNVRDDDGMTPLTIALQRNVNPNTREIVLLLLAFGASLENIDLDAWNISPGEILNATDQREALVFRVRGEIYFDLSLVSRLLRWLD